MGQRMTNSDARKRRNLLDMSNAEARDFFLKPESYITFELPEYFSFDTVLTTASQSLEDASLASMTAKGKSLSNVADINYKMLISKDGQFDWRPFQIIHPVTYVDLANCITEESNWKKIIKRFEEFEANPRIRCISIPVESLTSQKDTAATILNWWENLEQASIEYSLNYAYCIKTDITNCYGSIYTHSISWALHGKSWSKQHRKPSNGVGNRIDNKIQHLQFGQTNGIPQGSTLFDFVAEMVLGYSDLMLSNRLNEKKISNYQIIRFRDDYRIFSNSKSDCEQIAKELSDVLADLNMHFNSKKTMLTTDIISAAVKPDKSYWIKTSPLIWFKQGKNTYYRLSLQKHLMQIYEFSIKFPNSGSLKRALKEFLDRVSSLQKCPDDLEQLISIMSVLLLKNPIGVPLGVAILSRLFVFIDQKQISSFVDAMIQKFSGTPNIEYTEIWLQRLSVLTDQGKHFGSLLCQKNYAPATQIWHSEWLKNGFDESSIIQKEALESLSPVIPESLVDVFGYPDEI